MRDIFHIRFISLFVLFLVALSISHPALSNMDWCAKKEIKNNIEIMICNNSFLKKQDEILNVLYIAVQDIPILTSSDILKIKKTQKGWLLSKRGQCKKTRCLKNVYKKRIDALVKYIKKFTSPLKIGLWNYEQENDGKISCAGNVHDAPSTIGEIKIKNINNLQVIYNTIDWGCKEYDNTYKFSGYIIGNVGYVVDKKRINGNAILFISNGDLYWLYKNSMSRKSYVLEARKVYD